MLPRIGRACKLDVLYLSLSLSSVFSRVLLCLLKLVSANRFIVFLNQSRC